MTLLAGWQRRTRLGPLLVLVGLLATLAGCRLDVVAEVAVEADGSGTVALVFHLDDALLDELDALGVDPTAEPTAAVLDDDEWELERVADADSLVITVERAVADAAGFGAALRELTAGLAPDDPALLVDVEVEIDEHGASTIDGTVGFRAPATAGVAVDDEPLGPHGEELAAIVERAVTATLVVDLPGQTTASDADRRDGHTLEWEVPVGDERSISARAEPAPWWVAQAHWVAIGAGALTVLVLALLASWWWRRRRRRRPAQPMGSL